MALLRHSHLALLALRRRHLPFSFVNRGLLVSRSLRTTRLVLNKDKSEGSEAQYRGSNEASDSASASESGFENLSIQPTDLLALYRGLVARGDIEYDEDQVRAVMRVREFFIFPHPCELLSSIQRN